MFSLDEKEIRKWSHIKTRKGSRHEPDPDASSNEEAFLQDTSAVIQQKDELIAKLQDQIGMSKAEKEKHNEALKTLICETSTHICWRTTKFLSTKAQCAKFSRKIFDYLGKNGAEFDDTLFALWQETYGAYCVSALNKTQT